jgi:hypothetical protein
MIVFAAAATFAAAIPRYEDSWISPAIDWPRRGVDRNDYAAIEAELTVDTRGYVSNCQAHAAAGNPNMGPYKCQLLKQRAAFSPARDPDGHKIYGLHRVYVLWWARSNAPKDLPVSDFSVRVGRDIAVADSDKLTRISYAVDASGKLLSCGPAPRKQANALTAAACDQVPSSLVKPVTDRDGKPVTTVEDAVARILQQ